jgi:hypothetical protein
VKKMISFSIASLLALAAIAVPAAATKPSPPKKPTPPAPQCVAHSVAYEGAGKLTVAGSLSANADGTYNGTLTVMVANVNKHAKADKGTTRAYTLSNAHVTFGHGVDKTAPAAGSRANLKGTITTEPKRCTGFTPTVTITKVELHTAPK